MASYGMGKTLKRLLQTSPLMPEQRASPSSKGILAGLQLNLGFLLGFFILGYSPVLSILLGTIAGVAGGFIVVWWHAIDPVEVASEASDSETELPSEPISSLEALRLQRQKQYVERRQQQQSRRRQETKWQDWFRFRRNR
jgi:hypothetical protein